MGKESYFNLFILCVILAQEIGALLDNSTKDSLDLLVRRKRLVDRRQHGNLPITRIEDVPYVVAILEHNFHVCSGSILLFNVIITTAVCVIDYERPQNYVVLSGSAFRLHGTHHRVLKIRHHPEFLNARLHGDIALLTINPPVDHRINNPIELYNGPLLPTSPAIITGWGHTNISRNMPNELRSITLHAIGLDECRRELRAFEHVEVIRTLSDKSICTYDRYIEQHAGYFDDGNPLVINGKLAGIMYWSNYDGHPDIYVNLAYPTYRAWIVRMLGLIATNPP